MAMLNHRSYKGFKRETSLTIQLNLKIMISKISNLFIWWNGQTIGTKIYTKFLEILFGTDEYGNNYFKSSNGIIDGLIIKVFVMH